MGVHNPASRKSPAPIASAAVATAVGGPPCSVATASPNERGSADDPHDEETHARPAVSEGRKEPAHTTPRRG